jgi:N-acylneuraminate cytidylyltransferase
MRPKELSGDSVPSRAAEIHAIQEMTRMGVDFSAVCSMSGTSAFVGALELREGFAALSSGDWDFAISVIEYPHPPQRALRHTPDGSFNMANPEFVGIRTQDIGASYYDAGQFYWGKACSFLGGRSSLSARTTAVIFSRTRVVDIDTPEDWVLAEAVKKMCLHRSALQ